MIYVIIVYAQSLSKRISLYKGSRNTTDHSFDGDGLMISFIANTQCSAVMMMMMMMMMMGKLLAS